MVLVTQGRRWRYTKIEDAKMAYKMIYRASDATLRQEISTAMLLTVQTMILITKKVQLSRKKYPLYLFFLLNKSPSSKVTHTSQHCPRYYMAHVTFFQSLYILSLHKLTYFSTTTLGIQEYTSNDWTYSAVVNNCLVTINSSMLLYKIKLL